MAVTLDTTMAIETKRDLLRRLRRIEGQTRGLQTMVADERGCGEILQQIAAVEAALRQVALRLARAHLECTVSMDGAAAGDVGREVQRTLDAIVR